jgi:uncharacterized protein
VILLDANLLIYAVNEDAPQHRMVREWLESALSGDEEVRFPWVVLLAFLRLTTRPGLFAKPLSIEVAFDLIDEWLRVPSAAILHPGREHPRILRQLLEESGTGGNLTTDAHLAALAVEFGATLISLDHDFARFAGLKWSHPLKNLP